MGYLPLLGLGLVVEWIVEMVGVEVLLLLLGLGDAY